MERSGFMIISAKPRSQLLTLRLGSTVSAISQPKITSHCANPSSSEFRKCFAATRFPRKTPSISGVPILTYSTFPSSIRRLISAMSMSGVHPFFYSGQHGCRPFTYIHYRSDRMTGVARSCAVECGLIQHVGVSGRNEIIYHG